MSLSFGYASGGRSKALVTDRIQVPGTDVQWFKPLAVRDKPQLLLLLKWDWLLHHNLLHLPIPGLHPLIDREYNCMRVMITYNCQHHTCSVPPCPATQVLFSSYKLSQGICRTFLRVLNSSHTFWSASRYSLPVMQHMYAPVPWYRYVLKCNYINALWLW